jgi:hypothetical protein
MGHCDWNWDDELEKVMISVEWNTLGDFAGRNCRNIPVAANL